MEQDRPSIVPYLNVQQAHYPAFRGDGRELAFLSTTTGVPQVWQVGWSDEQRIIPWPTQRTFAADRVMGVWASPRMDDARVIFARDVGGNENAQLYVLDDEGSERLLTSGYEGAMHTFGTWSPDGTQIVFSSNRRDRSRFDLYVQSLDAEARILWQNDEPGYLLEPTFAPDGRRIAVVRSASSFSDELFIVDANGGTARRVSPDSTARFGSPVYEADGHSLLVVTDWESDFLYVSRLDLATGAMESVASASWDIRHLRPSPDGRWLAFVVNEDGISRLRLLERATGTLRDAPVWDAAPGVVAALDGVVSWSADSTALAFGYTSATSTSDIWVWNIVTDRVMLATRSSHGGLAPAGFVAPDLVHYPTFDERTIPAWLFTPQETPAPAVVVVHGGPEGQSVPSFNFLVQYLVAQGYAVFVPNVRGSTGYGKAYSHLDDVRLRMDSVRDLAHAAHWLGAQPTIQGDKIAVYGGSYGGFMVLAALTTNPELWAAGVDVVGISNFVTFLENTSAYRRGHREAEYGSLEHDRAFLEEISPITHIDNITAPLLVIHGANDPRVPVGEAEQLVVALDRRGVPTQLLVFDDEGHGVVKLKNKLVAYPAVAAFLDQHLKG